MRKLRRTPRHQTSLREKPRSAARSNLGAFNPSKASTMKNIHKKPECDYALPFKFTGDLKKVVVELGQSGLTAGDAPALEDATKKVAAIRD
jgi:hypothetical protein